jgi:hypothetical protein
MRKLLLAAALLTCTATVARAQTGTQDLNGEVQAINQIALTGSPSLVISTAAAGSAPTSVTANAAYAITTNETNRKITAQIDADAPAGVTIAASLAAPSGGTSAGAVLLSTTAQDVVTGISTVSTSGLNVTYTLSATAAAGVVPSFNRTVTYTITAGA